MKNLPYVVLHAPGTVFHEFAHSLFCCLAGVEVHKVVYFRLGNPAGYVIHAVPRHFRGQLAITSGPLLFNSLLGYVLFLFFLLKFIPIVVSVGLVAPFLPDQSAQLPMTAFSWPDLLLMGMAAWLGLSSVLHAFPSDTDAKALWKTAGKHVRKGNILALVGFPIAGFMYLVSRLKVVRLQWFYVIGIVWLAWISLAWLSQLLASLR